ncbi:SCO family protein [Dinoroseobacter sp. S76]|uniref:SCO family protein n=1 Tax=Dinoroseobacter sp. S76 TaxID=3415124 RepID=UPI003C7A36F0
MKLYAGTAIALVTALIGGTVYMAFFNSPDDPLAQCRGGVVATGSASIGGPFELVSETGETVTDAEVITKPSLIYFGYTFCPDVCPLDVARNAEAVDLLQERGIDVQPVFISIDPERDTPDVVEYFTDAMHPDMLGLTGSAEQVAAASKAYKTYYRKQEGDPEYYLVDHSTFTYLMMPESGFADFFRREASPTQMAERVACFVEHST